MTKREAVRLANAMAGLRPQIIPMYGPKWDGFGVEFSNVVQDGKGELAEVRSIERKAA
jgi:hypothetical protein